MTLGDNAVRFSPDGSYFTTSGVLGLENTVRQAYDVGESHSVGIWLRPNILPGSGMKSDAFRIVDSRVVGRFGLFRYHRNEITIGLIEDGAGTTNWRYEISESFGSPPVRLVVVGTSAVEIGKWYHVLGCKNSTYSARLFVNGVSETLELAGVPFQNNNDRFGGIGFDNRLGERPFLDQVNHENFDGDIHSVALWNLAISDEAVRSVYNGGWKDLDLTDDRNPCYNDGVNLAHWWRLGQGITDAHTFGNEFIADWVDFGGISITEQEGIIEQSDILSIGDAPSGTSVDFDGASAMSTPTAVPIGIVNEWTVSAWIKPREVLTTDSDILYIGPDSSEADSILISQNGDTDNDPLVVTVKDTAGTTIFAHEYNNVLTEDEWHHIGVTWDGAALNTYLDGSLLTPDVVGAGAGIAQVDSSRDILIGTGPLGPFDREHSVEVNSFADAMLTQGLRFTEFGGTNWSVAGWLKPQSTTPILGSDLGIFDRSGYDGVNILRNYNRTTIKLVPAGGSTWTLSVQIWDVTSATTGATNILWEFLTPVDIEDVFTNGMNEWNFFCMTYDEAQSGVGNIISMYMNGVQLTETSTTGTSITHSKDQPSANFAQISYGNTESAAGSGKWTLENVMAGRFHRLGLWGNDTLGSAEQLALYNGGNPPEIDWQDQIVGAYTHGQNDLTFYWNLGNHVWSSFAAGPTDWSELWNWGPQDDGTSDFLPTPWVGGDATTAWFHLPSWDLDGQSGSGVPDFIDGDPADSRPGGGVVNPWNGRMGHVGIWHEVLSADDIRTVYSKGQQLDLRYNVDGYSSAVSLENYFKPGEDSRLGRNFIDMNRPAASRVLTLLTGTPLSAGDSPISPFVAPALGESRSVSLDGVSEYFANSTNQLLGIANTWSASLWANRQQTLTDRQLLYIYPAPGGTDNTISIKASGVTNLECIIQNSSGAIIKSYIYNDVFPDLDEWRNIVFTWNGTLLLMYNNGVLQVPDILTVDNSGTMSDTSRSIFYGAFKVGLEKHFPGYLGHSGIWNTVLAAVEATEIFDNGHALDLRTDFGLYVSSASLKHFWRPGFEDVGFTDLQADPTSIDFDDSVNLDASDIVDEAPL